MNQENIIYSDLFFFLTIKKVPTLNLYQPFNPYEWLASNFFLQYHPRITLSVTRIKEMITT